MSNPTKHTIRRYAARQKKSDPIVYVAITFVVSVMVALFATYANSTRAASGVGPTGGSRNFWCGVAGKPACPADDPDWVPIKSDLPGDILAAIPNARMFAGVQSRHGHLSLDLPTLVHPFGTAGVANASDYFLDDHWVVSVRDDSGQENGTFDFVYDRVHQRIRFASFAVLSPQDRRYGHAFPYVGAAMAQARMQGERHVSVLAQKAPVLIFFPLDNNWQGPMAPHHWTSGGDSPMDPMWLFVGVDQQNYFVGMDLHTHVQPELPIASGQG